MLMIGQAVHSDVIFVPVFGVIAGIGMLIFKCQLHDDLVFGVFRIQTLNVLGKLASTSLRVRDAVDMINRNRIATKFPFMGDNLLSAAFGESPAWTMLC